MIFFLVDISSHYAFYYNPNYKLIEDGWALFQPEDEFAKIIRLADSDWRISYVNIDSSVSILMLYCTVNQKMMSFFNKCQNVFALDLDMQIIPASYCGTRFCKR